MPRNQLQLDSFLPSLIRNLTEGIAASMARRYAGPFRLTITEWRILLQLAEHEVLTATEVVEYSSMEKSKVSRAIATLESRDLVRREVAEDDNRTKNLAMTETGLEVYAAIVPRVLDWEKEFLEGLGTSEYRDFLYLVDKLSQRLKAMD